MDLMNTCSNDALNEFNVKIHNEVARLRDQSHSYSVRYEVELDSFSAGGSSIQATATVIEIVRGEWLWKERVENYRYGMIHGDHHHFQYGCFKHSLMRRIHSRITMEADYGSEAARFQRNYSHITYDRV
jgi:hypothetical protein